MSLYGWRGRIGVVIPSNNTVLEPEFARLVPEGVSAHASRILGRGSSAAELLEMVRNADRAIEELLAADVQTLLYACLSTSLAKGVGWDEEFATAVRQRTGRPCETAAMATVRGLRAMGARRIGLGTPYPEDLSRRLPPYLAAHGIEVASIENLGIADILEVCRREPREAYRLARSVWRADVDAVCLVATDFRTIDVLESLEEDLGVPVVSTNQALLWWALRSLGVKEAVPGFGSLLRLAEAAASDRAVERERMRA